MKKIISLLITLMVVISICSCTFNKNADDKIMEIADTTLEVWGLEEGRTFSVVLDDQNIYHVDVNGQELLVEIEKDYNLENAKSNITECDSEVMEIVKASKVKVINYINESRILNDKDELVEYINDVPVQMADFAIDGAAEYDPKYDSIFINNEDREPVCEWMIMHELVHALCQKTNGGVESERYPYSLFNEVLTDIITIEMIPEMTFETTSEYSQYFTWMYLYLGSVGIEGVEAYFYGYDKILDRIPEAELDIFVEAFEHVIDNEDAVIIVCNCINDWGLEK